MHLLITGSNTLLGQSAIQHFRSTHQLTVTDIAAIQTNQDAAITYHTADLRTPEAVVPLVSGVEAILHLADFDPPALTGATAEQDRLDIAARGTYVLLDEARKAGVERLILASRLSLFDAYPTDYIIDETWQPEPEPTADSLAPYLSEITCREYAREGGIRTICLRFGTLDASDGTAIADAMTALEQALVLPFADPGYRWRLFHISASDRFRTDLANRDLFKL